MMKTVSILICLFIGLTLLPATAQTGYGTKEIIIDSRSEFDHKPGYSVHFFKGHTESQPVDMFQGNADLSDPTLILTEETNKAIIEIITAHKNTPTGSPSLGELRMQGWYFDPTLKGGAGDTVEVYQDEWNRWSLRTPDPTILGTNAEEVTSLPVGGLSWIYQSFKVYRSGQLSKIRLKIRRHAGASKGTAPGGLYVAVLADNGATPGKPVEGAVLGYAQLRDDHPDLGVTPFANGTSPFNNIDVEFIGSNRPTVVAGTPYWLKITTMPYKR